MSQLLDSLVELIRRTSAEIPDDVHQAILTSLENEKKNSLAANAFKIIDQNIALAKTKSQPICQDTGSILFYVDCAGRLRPDHVCRNCARSREAGDEEGLSPAELRGFAHGQERRHELSGRARRHFIFISIARRKSA